MGVRRLTDLPAAARKYVERLSALLELPVVMVSVGPDWRRRFWCERAVFSFTFGGENCL